ncbi:hypothetical protein [Streptomyces sp. G45]
MASAPEPPRRRADGRTGRRTRESVLTADGIGGAAIRPSGGRRPLRGSGN